METAASLARTEKHVPILSQTIPANTLTTYRFMIHFNSILLPTPMTYKLCLSPMSPIKTMYAPLLPYRCNINGSSHSSSFQRPDNVLRTSTNHEGPHYTTIAAVLTSSLLGLNANDDSLTE